MGAAYLDTCAIIPTSLREALLETAYLGMYRVAWSNRIEEELTRTISRSNKERGIDDSTTAAYLSHLFKRMHHAFPGGSIELPPGSIGDYGDVPDPNDTHVIEGALRSDSDVIVTFNLKDFPPAILPKNLIAQHPDNFLLELWWKNPFTTLGAIGNIVKRTGRRGPRLTPVEFLKKLAIHTPRFSAEVLRCFSPEGA
ncbi:PIN domain-containing protein [Actinotignum sp. GS-2025c]|uniref:PIN domain-containing protein n=1 Tax=Actinotignum sp. GS-2025c TaxID=3427276 RepID=UPI003F448211